MLVAERLAHVEVVAERRRRAVLPARTAGARPSKAAASSTASSASRLASCRRGIVAASVSASDRAPFDRHVPARQHRPGVDPRVDQVDREPDPVEPVAELPEHRRTAAVAGHGAVVDVDRPVRRQRERLGPDDRVVERDRDVGSEAAQRVARLAPVQASGRARPRSRRRRAPARCRRRRTRARSASPTGAAVIPTRRSLRSVRRTSRRPTASSRITGPGRRARNREAIPCGLRVSTTTFTRGSTRARAAARTRSGDGGGASRGRARSG